MRLIDADKLKPDCLTKDGKFAISQSQIANASTVETDIEVVAKDAYERGYTDGWKGRFGEPDEKPQGEWIGNAFDEHHCKRCGHPALWEEEPDGYYEVQSRFCPNCGADMGGEEDNESES